MKQMTEKNKYFPCTFIAHEDDKFSIICTEFHYFDDYFGDAGGAGYTLNSLAKKLVKQNKIKGVEFDSEAGMFCAYSNNSENLLELCKLLRVITGGEENHLTKTVVPLISIEEAEILLLKGFVKSLDKKAQQDFFKNVPMPFLSKNQAKYLDNVLYGTDEEKIYSAKRINSEARTNTRNWQNYLSHPSTITILLDAIDKTKNQKVYTELLDAVVFICSRHLPDLRTQPYFLKALKSKIARNRQVAIWGLGHLYDYPFEEILPLLEDKAYRVREAILGTIGQKDYEYPPWMFDPTQSKVNKRPKDFSKFITLFNDENISVQYEALRLLEKLEEHEIFEELKDLIPIYKVRMEVEKEFIKYHYQKVIDRLENKYYCT